MRIESHINMPTAQKGVDIDELFRYLKSYTLVFRVCQYPEIALFVRLLDIIKISLKDIKH